ncbi:MAG: TolC family protein [Prolixibacteraceae bacterium]|jgi:outer membrane protein|nr:TolC family protein [Prolixibacteraceae bacterium]
MKKIIILIAIVALFVQGKAQEQWSLQKCIDYALENNIAIKQSQLDTEYQQNERNQAKFNKLPSVNASVSQNINFGRNEMLDGTYDNFNTSNTNASLGANVLIWKGGVLNKTIKQSEYSLKSSLENLQKAKDNVTLNIASDYLDILFALELVKVSEKQVEQTKKQIERAKQLVEAGKIAEGALLEIQAQLAREELDLVNRKNSLQIAYLNLAQLLELNDYSNFEIETPSIPELKAQASLVASNSVYQKAVEVRPEIKSAEYDLKNAEVQLELAKSGKMPTLSASAGISDNYSAFTNSPTLNDQITGNIGEYIGLNLSIPVFSKFQNRTNVENSKILIMSNELNLESAKKTLRKQIEQVYTNAVASMESYNANRIAVKSMEESFRYIEEKYNVGRVNSVEYNDAKTNLAISQSNLIQAKYEFIFRSKILDFYNGIPIEL